MTTYNKATLKTFFEQGDVPTGTNYADFIDSCVNLVETANQSMGGPLTTTELVTPRVSASTGQFSSVSAFVANMAVLTIPTGGFVTCDGAATFTQSVAMTSAVEVKDLTIDNNLNTNILSSTVSSLAVFCNISANNNDVYCKSNRYSDVGIVSAAGTAQSTATILTKTINRLQGINDGSATGFAIPANKIGMVQYIVNETNVSANLWPPTGGIINNLGANAVFAIAAGASYTIFHTRASAFGVK